MTATMPVASQPQSTGLPGWWRRRRDRQDRAARRAYRHSLPALYRWRRVIIGLVVAALAVVGVVVSRQNPVRWASERFYDFRNATAPVPNIVPRVEPAEATTEGSDPVRLVDGDVAAWTMTWAPVQQGSDCDAAAGTAAIVLAIPPSTIRKLHITAGLPDGHPELGCKPCRPPSASPSTTGSVIR